MFSRFLAVTPSGVGSQQGWVPYALDATLEMYARAVLRYRWGWARSKILDETILHGISGVGLLRHVSGDHEKKEFPRKHGKTRKQILGPQMAGRWVIDIDHCRQSLKRLANKCC
jgi:hypothetical protein